MRHLIVVLMLTLLPLRGWVGDAMAMNMAAAALAQPVSAIESGAYHAHGSMTATDPEAENAMPADCPGHAASAEDHPHATAHCETCTVCQICHAVALTPPFPHLAAASLMAGQPRAPHPHFASAERAPGFKPPIS